jgi:hypothetical protein
MKSEVEKLRALLAETQHEIAVMVVIGHIPNVEKLCSLTQLCVRIDAALAEPTKSEDAISHEAMLEKERDELRAEVERLKADLEVVESDERLAAKRWEAEAMRLQGAYRRGAEAMKEAVSHYLSTKGWFLNNQAKASILALPIPEDK